MQPIRRVAQRLYNYPLDINTAGTSLDLSAGEWAPYLVFSPYASGQNRPEHFLRVRVFLEGTNQLLLSTQNLADPPTTFVRIPANGQWFELDLEPWQYVMTAAGVQTTLPSRNDKMFLQAYSASLGNVQGILLLETFFA